MSLLREKRLFMVITSGRVGDATVIALLCCALGV
jgi:hypothetical protein